MRRHYLFLCFLLLAVTSTVVLVATTQARSVREGERAPETLAVPAGNMVSGLWQPLELTPTEAPVSPLAAPASELCTKPTTLKFPDGGQTTVNGALEVDTDPVLSCTNGTPPGPRGAQGYRTVWYQFTAPDSGYVLLEMEPNADYLQNYDTVLAVFEGPDPAFGETLEGVCPILETRELACNDDTNGFLSRVQVQVERGKSYLVEIADWQFGASGTRKLNVRSQFILPNYRWEQQELMALPRSRYAMTQVHDDLYLIGGQTIVSGNPVRTSSVQRYNLSDHTWTNLASLPGPDGLGYSNTGAAYLGNKIYVPSGYVGDDDLFDGAHWVYDISTDTWSDDLPSAPWPDGQAFAYVGAVGYAPFGIYYVIGGVTGTPFQLGALPHAEMFAFQPGNPNLWLERPPLNVARYAHTTAQVGNKICVAGGVSSDNLEEPAIGKPIVLANGECYNTITGEWVLTGNMSYARYNAGSAVGADGRWYVFGGTDALGMSVPDIEVYDPTTNTWSVLDGSYDLRSPARAWALGGFWNGELWVVGGHHNTATGDEVVPVVQKMLVPEAFPAVNRYYFPIAPTAPDETEIDNTFALATQLPFNQYLSNRFRYPGDYFDMYTFMLEQPASVVVRLQDIEAISNYDVLIYSTDKVLLGVGNQVGNLNESVPLGNLPAGRYYVMVVRASGQSTLNYYQVAVEK